MRPAPGETFGRYRIEAELGRGGQAIVYRATQVDLERPVALKVFDDGQLSRPGAMERFRREAVAAGRLEHPRIVTVYDAGEIDGTAFISMRLIPGDTLASRIARHGALDPALAIEILLDIAGAIDFAHARGVVHRDVTPGNILLDATGAYLGDFGLVRIEDRPGVTRRGDWLGTAEYVSPEQVEGEPAGPASDRYALAAVTFEALTGRAPYVRREAPAVLLAHVREPAPDASALNPDLPTAVDEPLARGLAKRTEDRPDSASALVEALAGALGLGRDPHAAKSPRAAADPWAIAFARFSVEGGEGHFSPGEADAGPERATEAFGGRSPKRPVAVGRDVALAMGIGAFLLLVGSLVGGWMLGTSTADTGPVERQAFSEGRAVGLDAGFRQGRAQGVREGRAAGRDQGLEAGRTQGRRAGLRAGREAGFEQGREEGFAAGREEGYSSGVVEGRRSALGALSSGSWYVVWVGSDSVGPQIGRSMAISPDSGTCYTVSGDTVFSGVCNGGADE